MDISNLPNLPKTFDQLLPSLYEDVVQPPAREIGLALKKVIEVLLSPIGLTYGAYEVLQSFAIGVQKKLIDRVTDLGENFFLKQPQERFSKVLMRNVLESGAEENIRELFENLLVNEMLSKDNTHNDFANIIGRMSPEEAKLFIYVGKRSYMWLDIKIQDPNKVSTRWFLDNSLHFDRLESLGLTSSYDRVKEENLKLTPFGLSLFMAVIDESSYEKLFGRARRMKHYLMSKSTESSESENESLTK